MYIEYDANTRLWNVYNNRSKVVASFLTIDEAYNYLEQ